MRRDWQAPHPQAEGVICLTFAPTEGAQDVLAALPPAGGEVRARTPDREMEQSHGEKSGKVTTN